MLSTIDLSPLNIIPRDHGFIVLSKSYFDGGGSAAGTDAEGNLYQSLTLASFTGLRDHWIAFESDWDAVTQKHKAPPLHATDAMSLSGEFSLAKGWSDARVDETVEDYLRVVEDHCAISNVRAGIRPVIITVLLDDFESALIANPELESPIHVAAIQCTGMSLTFGSYIGGSTFELIFDRGEPFRGHLVDRWKNPRSVAINPVWKQVTAVAEASSHVTPGLQVADLWAWTVNDVIGSENLSRSWQSRLLVIEREQELYDSERLSTPFLDSIQLIQQMRLPKRRPYKRR